MILKNIFNYFKKNKRANKTPVEKISWNDVVNECYDKGLEFTYPVSKVIYTDDKSARAVILQKPDMTYMIAYQKLYPFDEDELKYIPDSLPGYWTTSGQDGCGIFDTEERAINEVLSSPPFMYNKSILWADIPFRIDIDNLHWINDDGVDDPDDFCLHGHAVAKIGEEIFEYHATVSATGLYLLRTLTENHIIHDDQAMLPCCGHWMVANNDLSSVDIGGCSNGIDWSVIHQDGKIKLVTEAGQETLLDMDDYREEVYAFADKIEAFYRRSSPKNISKADSISRNGYIAFWNEWHRRRK